MTFGKTFLQALKEKYVDNSHSVGEKEIVILGSSNGAIEVEAVGLERVRAKLSRLERLREISLNSENVAFPDPPGEIRTTCPSKNSLFVLINYNCTQGPVLHIDVRSLDLSDSLLSSWRSVALIACELPALRNLTLEWVTLMHRSCSDH